MKSLIEFIFLIFAYYGFMKFIESLQPLEAGISDNGQKGLKNFYENEGAICKNGAKKYEDLIKTIDNYVQRYVSLFLISTNLRDYEIKDVNEMITIDLEITINGEDLTHLQGYSKSGKDTNYPKNFSKLDAIFSKIARLKERSYAEKALKYSKSFFANFINFSNFISTYFFYILSFLVTLLMTWLIHHYIFHKSFYMFLGLTINSMIFWESLSEYWKRLKEADIEIFVNTIKGAPEECNPANSKWYQSVLNIFRENPCLQYYKNINKNPVTEVSLFQCIVDTYSYYLIRTPFKLYGSVVRDITQEISALWPGFMRIFVNLSFVPFFGIVLAFFILILCRKQLRLSFFGATVEIGDSKRITGITEKPALAACETPKTDRIIRKLKPWTKSRFPKRLDGNLRKRKKFFLKAYKSESELPSQDEEFCVRNDFHTNQIQHD